MKSELARRIVFTLGALLIYRLGTSIPLPGINTTPLLSGNHGSIARVSIFAMGILPYFSAAILIQLVSMVSSKLSALTKGGEAERRKITRYTFGLSVVLAAFQSFGVASALQNIPNLVSDPGGLFLLSTTVSLTGGMVFLIWLSEQITLRGIGNGLAWLLFAGLAVQMPRSIAAMVELTRQGALSAQRTWLLAILWVALVGLVVFVELARRRVPVEFASRKLGGRLLPARSTHLSFKLNSAGLLPIAVAPWLFLMPLTLLNFVFGQKPAWLAAANGLFLQNHIGSWIFSSVVIFIFAFIYTAFVVDPEQAADSLQRNAGVIPGIGPGEATAQHLDHVVSYTTCAGAVYLTAVFLIPQLLSAYGEAPFYLAGASVLVAVCIVLDIEKQVRGQSLTEPGGAYR